MKEENIALFDMDGTLCDYDGAMNRDLKLIQSPFEDGFVDFHKPAPDYLVKRMSLIKTQPDWWLNLEVYKLGMDIYQAVEELGFNIHILTQGPATKPNAWAEKVKWCYKNLGKKSKVTITQDKGLVYGKVLVDDYPEYVMKWLKWRKRGIAIMPENKHNENFRHPSVVKYNGNNIEEVKTALKLSYNRNTGG